MLPTVRPARRPSTALAALATVSVLALAACSSGEATDPAGTTDDAAASQGSGGTERAVSTDRGEVTVPAEPQRVVVLNHALAGYLYALDVPVLATIPEAADAANAEFSPFWADDAEADGTELMDWSADGFNLEAILAQEPDLIVAGGWGFPYAQADDAYDRLSDIAPTVLVSSSYGTWQEQLEFLADDVLDRSDEADALLAGYDERLAEVTDTITVPDGDTAFLSFTADPTAYALFEDSSLPAVFADLGFEIAPVHADTGAEPYTPGGDMFVVSDEMVSDVVTAPNVFVMGFNGDTIDLAQLEESPVYAGLPAFEAGNAHELPYWVLRGDYHEAMALLDVVEEQFAS
ncbi:ABC transporter substrate-binding protein [Cellulosimicrobium terreum]|nr:ABC transporter substrate-binding protein [Cellulosimicrobium terreum]